jgi:DNA polymerase-3 subunit alpha
MGIRVLPPDVNQSRKFFAVVAPEAPATGEASAPAAEPGTAQAGAGDIRFGLAAIKNVGEGAVDAVLRAREEAGPFRSLHDFAERVDLRAVNRRVVESFVKSGCFDSVDPRRATLFAVIERAMETGQKRQRDKEQGQASLLGLLAGQEVGAAERLAPVLDWGEGERLAYEKESLGFFITGHPLERFRAELAQWATATTALLPGLAEAREVSVGGIIAGLRLVKTKRGDRMATFQLEDLEGGVECLVFPETFKRVAGRLGEDQIVLVKGKAEPQDEAKARLVVSEVLPLEQAKLAEARYVTVRVPMPAWSRSAGERLRDILDSHRGECPVTLELVRPGSYAVALAAGAAYRVRPDTTLKGEIEALFGPGALVLARINGLPRD